MAPRPPRRSTRKTSAAAKNDDNNNNSSTSTSTPLSQRPPSSAPASKARSRKPAPSALPLPPTTPNRAHRHPSTQTHQSPYPLSQTTSTLLSLPTLDISTPSLDPDFQPSSSHSPHNSPNNNNSSSAPTTATSASFSNGALTEEEDEEASPVRLVRGKRKRRVRWMSDWGSGGEIDALGWGKEGDGEEEEEEGKGRKRQRVGEKANAEAPARKLSSALKKRKTNATKTDTNGNTHTSPPRTPGPNPATVPANGTGTRRGRPPRRAKSVTFHDTPVAAAAEDDNDDGIRQAPGNEFEDPLLPTPGPTPSKNTRTRSSPTNRNRKPAAPPPPPAAAASLFLSPPSTPATPASVRRSGRLFGKTLATAPPPLAPPIAPAAPSRVSLASSSAPAPAAAKAAPAAGPARAGAGAGARASTPTPTPASSSFSYAADDERELEVGPGEEPGEEEDNEEEALGVSPTPALRGRGVRGLRRGGRGAKRRGEGLGRGSGSQSGSGSRSRSESRKTSRGSGSSSEIGDDSPSLQLQSALFESLAQTQTQAQTDDAGVDADEESAALPTADKAVTTFVPVQRRGPSPAQQGRGGGTRETPAPALESQNRSRWPWPLHDPERQEWRRGISVGADEGRQWQNARGEWAMSGIVLEGEDVGAWGAAAAASGTRRRGGSLSPVNEPVTRGLAGTAVRGYRWPEDEDEDGDEVLVEEEEEEAQVLPTPPPSGGQARQQRRMEGGPATSHQAGRPQNIETEAAAEASPRSTPSSTHTPSPASPPPTPPSPLSTLLPPSPISPAQAISLLNHLNHLIHRFALFNFTSPSFSSSPVPTAHTFPPSLLSTLLSSPSLISTIHSIADGSQYGWPTLFTTPSSSSVLIEGIISRVLYEQVFKKTCFGASDEEAEWLDREEAMAEARREGFVRKSIRRAERVRVLREKTRTSLPGRFDEEVRRLVEELGGLVEPLLPAATKGRWKVKGDGEKDTEERSRLREELEGIVAFAALLSISFRDSPLHPEPALSGGSYESVLARPGSEFDGDMMNCVNQGLVEDTHHHGGVGGGYTMHPTPASERVKIASAMGLVVDLPRHPIQYPSPSSSRNQYSGIRKSRFIRKKTQSHAHDILVKPAVWVETTPLAFLYYPTSEKYISNARLKRPWGRKITLRTAIARDLELQKLKRHLGDPFSRRNLLVWARPLLKSAFCAAAIGGVAYAMSPAARRLFEGNLHRVMEGARVVKRASGVVWERKGALPRRMREKVEELWASLVEGCGEVKRQTGEALREPLGERVREVVREDYENLKVLKGKEKADIG